MLIDSRETAARKRMRENEPAKFKIVNSQGQTLANVKSVIDVMEALGPCITERAMALSLRGQGITAFFADLPPDGLIAYSPITWGDIEPGYYYLEQI